LPTHFNQSINQTTDLFNQNDKKRCFFVPKIHNSDPGFYSFIHPPTKQNDCSELCISPSSLHSPKNVATSLSSTPSFILFRLVVVEMVLVVVLVVVVFVFGSGSDDDDM
jgi:hypothetical protein